MRHFIAAKDAMQKYGIRERQIWDVIHQGKIGIYDNNGTKVGITEFAEYSYTKIKL